MQNLIILAANLFIVLPVLVTGYVFVRLTKRRRIKFALQVIAGGALSLSIALIAGKLIHDPRPFVAGHFTPLIKHSSDNGFPSDHTLLAAFLGWTILSYSRRLGIGTLLIAGIIGVARMAAGVHHSWDILGSFVLSGLSAFAVQYALNICLAWRARQVRAGTSTSK